MLTSPAEDNAEVTPGSAGLTRTSLTAEAATFWIVPPTVSSLMSTPSSRRRVVRPERSSTDRSKKPALLGSATMPSRICTPGSSCARSRKLRPLIGSGSNSLRGARFSTRASPGLMGCNIASTRATTPAFTSALKSTV